MSFSIVKSVACGLLAALVVSPANAIVLDLDVTPQPAQVGEVVHATFGIDSQGSLFDGFSLSIDYDPTVLSYLGADFSVFSEDYTFTFSDPEPVMPTGTIQTVTAGAVFDDFTGSFDLVKFTFEAIGVGTSAITLNDAPSGLIALDGANVQSGPVSASATVVPLPPTVIPLPAAGWLLVGGLGSLVAFRRKARLSKATAV